MLLELAGAAGAGINDVFRQNSVEQFTQLAPVTLDKLGMHAGDYQLADMDIRPGILRHPCED